MYIDIFKDDEGVLIFCGTQLLESNAQDHRIILISFKRDFLQKLFNQISWLLVLFKTKLFKLDIMSKASIWLWILLYRTTNYEKKSSFIANQALILLCSWNLVRFYLCSYSWILWYLSHFGFLFISDTSGLKVRFKQQVNKVGSSGFTYMRYADDKFDILPHPSVKAANFPYVVWICSLSLDSIKMRSFPLLGENLVSKAHLCTTLTLGKVRLLSTAISAKCDYTLSIEAERV